MAYTLIMNNGRRMQFHILAVAELYQQIYGGILLDNLRPRLKLVDKLAA